MKNLFIGFFITLAMIASAQASRMDLIKAIIQDKNLTLQNNKFGLALMEQAAADLTTRNFRASFKESAFEMLDTQNVLAGYAIPTYVKKVGSEMQGFSAIFPRAYGITSHSNLEIVIGQLTHDAAKISGKSNAISSELLAKLNQLAATTTNAELKQGIAVAAERAYSSAVPMVNGRNSEAISIMIDISKLDEAALTKLLDEVSQVVRASAKLAE